MANAQIDTTVAWEKVLGGTQDSHNTDIKPTADGGYIVAGLTAANDGDASGTHGGTDAWVVKVDAAGNVVWQKCLGGSRNDMAKAIQPTSDGGYLMVGSTASNDGDVSGNHNNSADSMDVWLVKLSAAGTIVWQKCFGGTGNDIAHSLQVAPDNGFIFTAGTTSTNGDVVGTHPDSCYWVAKLNSNGTLLWQNCFAGAAFTSSHYSYNSENNPVLGYAYTYFNGSFIQNTSDNGFVIAAQGGANVAGNHGGLDYLVLKIDNLGNIQWQTSLGYGQDDIATSIQLLPKGGYLVMGNSALKNTSNNLNDTSYLQVPMLAQLDAAGNVQWQKQDSLRFTKTGIYSQVNISANTLAMAANGDYLIAGYASGHYGLGTSLFGWVAKLDSTGTVKGISYPQGFLYAFLPTGNGSYIASGDIYPLQGLVDSTYVAHMYIVKFKENLLPVTLLVFTATPQKSTVFLQWQTAAEINTSHYAVQRSMDAQHFTTVGKLNAAGNSATAKRYMSTDEVNGLLASYSAFYYRLQVVDKNGQVTYSKIAKAIFNGQNIAVMATPNPVKNQLTIRISNYNGNAAVVVYDMAGRAVRPLSQYSNKGGISLNIADLAKGTYIINATINGTKLETKFVKQ